MFYYYTIFINHRTKNPPWKFPRRPKFRRVEGSKIDPAVIYLEQKLISQINIPLKRRGVTSPAGV